MKYYLGIDGGGTKTEFLLSDGTGNETGYVLQSSCNPNDVGRDRSYGVLRGGVEEILKSAGVAADDAYIYAGVAGAGVGDNAKCLQERLKKDYPHIEIGSDLGIAIETCLQGEDGLVVICGTGVSCCIRENGACKTIGGYGYLFEDGGSGYAYGRDAVRAVLRYEDGVGEKTVLSEYFRPFFGGKSARDALCEILHGGKTYVASFCPLVFKGYTDGDKVCGDIIERNLKYAVSLVKDALSVCNNENNILSFIGGISGEELFRRYMINEFGGQCELRFCDEKPVYGALRLAISKSKEIAA